MKQALSLVLAILVCLTVFSGCGEKSGGPQSATQNGKTYPCDIVENLPYTFTVRNADTKEAESIVYLEGSSPDDGRINDGKIFTQAQVDDHSYLPLQVQLDDCKGKEYQISFATDGKHDAIAVVFHNSLFTMSSCLEVEEVAIGGSAETLTSVDFEDDMTNKLDGSFADYVVSFSAVQLSHITVTFSSAGAYSCEFSEISVVGFPTGEKETYLPEDWEPGDDLPSASSAGDVTSVISDISNPDSSSEDGPSKKGDPKNGDDEKNRPADVPTGKLNKQEKNLCGAWQGTDPESGDSVYIELYNDRSGTYKQTGSNATFNFLVFWHADDNNVTFYFNLLGYRAHQSPFAFEGGNVMYMQDEDGRSTKFTRVK